MHFCQQPPPHPRLRKEIPIHFCRQPPPRPRLRRRIPIHLCRHPPPRPRLRRSSPAPAGRGQCVAISGEQPYPGCNRGEAVFGSSPAYSRALDRGDIAFGGGGPRGGGTCSPSPVSHAPDTLLLASPTPPAPSALRPLPGGAGSVRGDIRGAAVPGVQPVGHRARLFSRISPYAGPWGYRHWGRRPAGRGNLFPLPCLSRSRHLAPCQPYPARPSAGRLPMHFCRQPPPLPSPGSLTIRAKSQKERGAAGELRRQRRGL